MNGEISSSASGTMGLSISSSLTAGRAFSMNYTSTRFESSTGGANINNTDGDDENGKTSMDDEYGAMSSSGRTYTHPTPYRLESYGTFGHSTSTLAMSSPRRISPGVLSPANVTYNTYGTLNATRDNVLVICHALTGNASLEAWWGDLLGPGKAFDTDRYYVVCCNILGSCYGSVGPSSLRPGYDHENDGSAAPSTVPRNRLNQAIYGVDFPDVSVRDTVRLQLLLLKNELRISSIKCVIGGSFGGMQAMEYCVMAGATRARDIGDRNAASGFVVGGTGVGGMVVDKDGVVPYMIGEFTTKRNGRIEPFVRSAVPIACGAAHTAWQVGISETQRQAIYADPRWNGGRFDPHDPPNAGLSVARQVAMISYRTPYGYHKKFGRSLTDESGPSYGSKAPWQVKSYLEYQGAKFVERFDPVTYVKLTEQMDSHDVGRGRGSIEQVLSQVEIPVCVLGIDSDVLYPLREQEELARYMPNAELKIIHSDAGHDGFLLEQDQVAAHIKSFLYSHD
jgi:homoserine O-acetyltransferase